MWGNYWGRIKHDNIRVMLKTTGYKDLFHNSVSLSSDSIIHITCADVQWDIAAGESFDIDSNDERLATGRIVLSTDDGSITIILLREVRETVL